MKPYIFMEKSKFGVSFVMQLSITRVAVVSRSRVVQVLFFVSCLFHDWGSCVYLGYLESPRLGLAREAHHFELVPLCRSPFFRRVMEIGAVKMLAQEMIFRFPLG